MNEKMQFHTFHCDKLKVIETRSGKRTCVMKGVAGDPTQQDRYVPLACLSVKQCDWAEKAPAFSALSAPVTESGKLEVRVHDWKAQQILEEIEHDEALANQAREAAEMYKAQIENESDQ